MDIARVDFRKIGALRVVIFHSKYDTKNSINPDSCSPREGQSSYIKILGLRNYCWSDGMLTSSFECPSIENLDQKLSGGYSFVALSVLYLQQKI